MRKPIMVIFRFRQLSFRLQIALVFGAVVLGLIAALSLTLAKLQATTARDQARSALQVVSNNAQRALAEGLHQRLLIVEALAASENLWSYGLDSEQAQTAIAQQQMVGFHLAWIGITGVDGIVKAATGGLLRGVDVRARPWFAAGLRGPHVGDVHQALLLAKLLPPSSTGEPQRFVDFSAPIRVAGAVVGVIALHGGWDWARSVIESQLPDDAQSMAMDLFVCDRNGILIYVPGGRTDIAVRPGDRLAEALALERGMAEVVRWPNGREYLTSASPMRAKDAAGDLGWIVVARTPKDLAYAPVRQAVVQVMTLGGLAALVAMGLAWLVSGSISKPLSAIGKAAQDVLSGKKGATIPNCAGSAELRYLSGALIEMTAQLETQIREHTELARFDSLTTLLNRRGFDEQMDLAVRNARRRVSPLSVVAIDVDHFKKVNDRLGHDAGDAVLRKLATLLKDWFRETDVVARMGGEEFTVLLLDTDLAQATSLAEELVAHVSSTVFPTVGPITISCGISQLIAAEDALLTLKRADRALYRAKTEGRNRTVTLEEEVAA